MGQGKTGTTSLQQSLHSSAELLSGRNAFYPRFESRSPAHHLLIARFGSPERLPRWTVERFGGFAETIEAAWDAWDGAVASVQEMRPELLVLSSEHILSLLEASEKSRLARELLTLSQDILTVAYIRHPVHHFRARLQQSLKKRTDVPEFKGSNLRQSILDVEAAFGRRPELIAFDRSLLHGGDIVQDFAERFLSPWIKPSDLPTVHANQGLSAEALALMIELRAESGGTYEAAREISRLVPLLSRLDESDPPAEPLTLLPEVAEAVLRAASSHRWLVETGQLQIPGLDINRIDGTPIPDWIAKAPPGLLFRHDPARLDRLRRAVEEERSIKAAAKASDSAQPAKPQRVPKPDRAHKPKRNTKQGVGDFLLRFVRRKLASLQDRNTGAASSRQDADRR